jgi:2-polyprenyl-6-methoxyphenol hydroxylase-like FAD-dependent oxidoreductase
MKETDLPGGVLGEKAVVIGSSIAGMVAGQVLTRYFKQVTIIERDPWDHWTAAADFRQGVPQARHPHILLKRGEQILNELFPALTRQLKDQGAININTGTELAWFTSGNFRPRYVTSLESLACSRPMLETTLRRRLNALNEVSFRIGWEVTGLLPDPYHTRARAVKIRARDGSRHEQLIEADFIVDASGRESKAPEWLDYLGFPTPRETVIDAFPGYATRIYQRPAHFQGTWKGLYIQPTAPDQPRGGLILPLERDRWHVTLIGMNRDYPPTDEPGFLDFARSLAAPQLYEALKEAEPLTAISGYRSGSNRLRHYEELPAYLENFVVLGDAAFAFNPVYGQGMTVAALAGIELGRSLQERLAAKEGLTGLAGQFQKRLMEIINLPWQVATREDTRWSSASALAPGLDPSAILLRNYLSQVLYATTRNPVVAETFYLVMNMLEAPNVFFRPDIVLQVAAELSPGLPVAS